MCWLWDAKSFLLSSCNRAIPEMFPFLCSVLCLFVQKKNFHLWKVSTHRYYSLCIIYSFYMLSILLLSIVRGRSECRLFEPLELLLLLPPSTFEMCTVSRSHWSRDIPYCCPLENARWHIFTFEVTVGDSEIGGPFQPHTVSLITVCQLLVWLCMSAH